VSTENAGHGGTWLSATAGSINRRITIQAEKQPAAKKGLEV
jgi:hypothetical protein